MKDIVQFDLDGKPVYMEVENQEEAYGGITVHFGVPEALQPGD